MTVGLELYCSECCKEQRFDDIDSDEAQEAGRCPKCGRKMCRNRFITCECGTTVYLDFDSPLTNECPTCGRLYDGSGEELTPPREKNGAMIVSLTNSIREFRA